MKQVIIKRVCIVCYITVRDELFRDDSTGQVNSILRIEWKNKTKKQTFIIDEGEALWHW